MMKRLALLICCILAAINLLGQDRLYTKDGEVLEVKIIEQKGNRVQYQMYNYTDGPLLHANIMHLQKIEYQNGFIDNLGNQNPRRNRPFGFNIGFTSRLSGDGGWLFFNLDYFVIPQVSLEVNVGSDGSRNGNFFSSGAKYHLNSNHSTSSFTPFTGLLVGNEAGYWMAKVPVGINYLAKNGLNVAVSFNQLFFFDSYYESLFEIKFGWKFSL